MKCCTKCGVEKPLIEFYVRDNGKHRNDCILCNRERKRQRRSENPERAKEADRLRYERDREKILKSRAEYYQRNRQTVDASRASWRARNIERARTYTSAWAKRNRAKTQAILYKYRSTKLQAVPLWFEKEAVEEVYKKAAEMGFHVDHVVPLQGKTVCGLHCWANLQVLAPEINIAKSNRMWPDMP